MQSPASGSIEAKAPQTPAPLSAQLDIGPNFQPPAERDPQELAELVVESLESSKAEDINSIDIIGKSALADYIIVASGRSHRHVGAIADNLTRALKDKGYGTAKVEGLPACDWVLVDAGDVLIHIFRPEVRAFYAIEKMWSDGTGPRSRTSS